MSERWAAGQFHDVCGQQLPRSMFPLPTEGSALPMWQVRTKPRTIFKKSSITCMTPVNIRPSVLPAQRDPAGGPSRNRQDHAGKGSCGRSKCALFLHLRLGIRGDVCGHGRFQGSQSVRPGKGKSPLASFSSMRSMPSAKSAAAANMAAMMSASRPSTSF